MRNIRFLLLLLSLAVALAVVLVRPLPSRAEGTQPDSGGASKTGPTNDQRPGTKAAKPARARKHRPTRKLAAAVHATVGARVVSYAQHLIGVPYRYGGTSPRTGFDCSGFVRYVYAHFGISLSHSSFADYWRGTSVGRWAMKPGDLVFFDGRGHVGIYIGHNRFIHAPHTGTVVRISTMDGWYSSRFDGARRIS